MDIFKNNFDQPDEAEQNVKNSGSLNYPNNKDNSKTDSSQNETAQQSNKKGNDSDAEDIISGLIGLFIICALIFFGLKSCIGCDNNTKDNDKVIMQNDNQMENEKRFEEQQKQIRKQQKQIDEQERRFRQQEREKEQMFLKQKHGEIVRSCISITDGAFVPNIFDGYVYFSFNLFNRSSKTIKYFYVWVTILNRVSDPIQKNWCGKYTGPLNSATQDFVSFQLTNNPQASQYSITRMRIEYMDGTYLEISPDEINQIYKPASL